MGQGSDGVILERQVVTFVIDRLKGHVFILKNGKLLAQDVTEEKKQGKLLETIRAAVV